MIMRRLLIFVLLMCPVAGLQAAANPYESSKVAINSTEFLGALHLKKHRLEAVKKAVEAALQAPLDEHESCGDDPLGCYARAAEIYKRDGVEYREIVVIIHGVGNGRFTFHQINGKWPEVVVK
jgi:hypothetical protein